MGDDYRRPAVREGVENDPGINDLLDGVAHAASPLTVSLPAGAMFSGGSSWKSAGPTAPPDSVHMRAIISGAGMRSPRR